VGSSSLSGSIGRLARESVQKGGERVEGRNVIRTGIGQGVARHVRLICVCRILHDRDPAASLDRS
jgi:hypothetical protein